MAINNTFSGATRDPFYEFNKFQKTQGKDMTTSPVIGGPSGYLEKNPAVAYNRYLTSLGVGQADTSAFAQWARKQFEQTQLGHNTAMAENPTLSYQKYLGQLGFNNIYREFMRLSPQQRGENQSRFVGPVRTISDI